MSRGWIATVSDNDGRQRTVDVGVYVCLDGGVYVCLDVGVSVCLDGGVSVCLDTGELDAGRRL